MYIICFTGTEGLSTPVFSPVMYLGTLIFVLAILEETP